jgi:ribokinase
MIQFPLGAKIKVESVIQGCGGGATNTSVGFSRLGLTAQFCGVIADDEWGKGIQETLRKEGVLTDTALVVEGEVSSFSVILVDNASGMRTVLYSANVNAHLREPVFPKEVLCESRWLFLNHLTDVSCIILDDVADIVCQDGCHFAWNPGGSQIRDGVSDVVVRDLLVKTDLLFLNAQEAMTFTRTATIGEALRCGTEHGVRVMCVTDGSRGAHLSDGTTFWRCPSLPNVPVIDTTGAGDAFATGVTWAIFRQMDLPEALKAGMLNAASVIGKVGTQVGLLSETELRQELSETDLPVITSPLVS